MLDGVPIPAPVNDNITKAIQERARRVKPPVEFQRLYEHVATGLAALEHPCDYATTFSQCLGHKSNAERHKLRAAMIDHLEAALANVLLAHKLKTDQPYRNKSLNNCIEFDHMCAKHALLDDAQRQARVRGGLHRQRRLDPVRTLAARRAKEILCGRPSLTDWAVARIIEPEVVAFVREQRLAVVCAENLLRTIVAWIRRDRDAVTAQQ